MKTNKRNAVWSVMLFIVSALPIFGQANNGGGGGGGGTTTVSPPTITPTVAQPVKESDGFAPTLPITSREVLLANNKRLITTVATGVNSSGFVYGDPGVKTYAEKAYVPSMAGQPDFSEINALVVSIGNFVFETRNPDDNIEMRVTYQTKQGRAVFQGIQYFKLVQNPNGIYAPPSPSINVRIYPSDEQLLNVPGADWVEVSFLSEKGETVQTQQMKRDEQTGMFFFPLSWAGLKNIQLTAYRQNQDNGTTAKAVYSAQTGGRQPTVTRSVIPSVSIENTVIVPADKNVVTINMSDEQSARSLRNGVSPLVQITFRSPLRLSFYAEIPSEVANGFWMRQGNQSNWNYFTINKGQGTTIDLGAGVYDIIIDWPTFGRREDSFSNDGHGKN